MRPCIGEPEIHPSSHSLVNRHRHPVINARCGALKLVYGSELRYRPVQSVNARREWATDAVTGLPRRKRLHIVKRVLEIIAGGIVDGIAVISWRGQINIPRPDHIYSVYIEIG